MWRYSGVEDPTRDYIEGKFIINLAFLICDLSRFIDYILLFVDLWHKEIDAWVKLICEKVPPNTEEAPQILAVVSEEEKQRCLKVIDILFDFIFSDY